VRSAGKPWVAADTVGLFEGAHYFHCGASVRHTTAACGPSGAVLQGVPGQDPQQAPQRLQTVLLRRDGEHPDAGHPDVVALRSWRDGRLALARAAVARWLP
jgi:hypothetical protein